MKKQIFWLIAGLVFLCNVVSALDFDGTYSLMVGETKKIEAQGLTRVSMFTPGIANVVKTSKSGVEVIGVAAGSTILELGTKGDKKMYRLDVKQIDVDDLIVKVKELLQQQLGFNKIVISKNSLTNRVLLEGSAPEKELEKIGTVLGPLSQYVDNFVQKEESEDIVEIEVKIIEINTSGAKHLGISLPSSLSYGEGDKAFTRTAKGMGQLDPLFNLMDSQSRSPLTATLNFLQTTGNAEVLATPTISCLSGKEASMNIGGSVPILTTAGTGTEASTAVQYMNYGLGLTVSPVVRPDGLIEINLSVDISDLDSKVTLGSDSTTTASASATTSRKTSTVMLMEASQTMSISGLIKKNKTEDLVKFPWLADVPVLGHFFQDKNKTSKDTELVILLTPVVKKMTKSTPREKADAEFKDQTTVITHSDKSTRDQAISEYALAVRDEILSGITFPESLSAAGVRAEATITMHVAEDGFVLGVTKTKGTSYEAVDDVLMAAVGRIKSFRPFPSTISEKELWLDIPIVFDPNV